MYIYIYMCVCVCACVFWIFLTLKTMKNLLRSFWGSPSNTFRDALNVKKNAENIWVNYNELTTSSLEIIVSKGNHPQMALIQVSEL